MDSHTSDFAKIHDFPSKDQALFRLLTGQQVEEIAVYDVSDCQLYGQKCHRRLVGWQAQAAAAVGCLAVVYQSIYWFTLVYIPIWPLGTYLVLPRQSCNDPDGDALQYRAIRLPMDWVQVTLHYTVTLMLLSIIAVVVTAILSCSKISD